MSNMFQGARMPVTALASATSADGTARNGATIATAGIEFGTLCVLASTTIVTGSVVGTWRWQVSLDGTTFRNFRDASNPAATTETATSVIALACPAGVQSFPYARVTATLSGATTAAGDLTAATYYFIKFDEAR